MRIQKLCNGCGKDYPNKAGYFQAWSGINMDANNHE